MSVPTTNDYSRGGACTAELIAQHCQEAIRASLMLNELARKADNEQAMIMFCNAAEVAAPRRHDEVECCSAAGSFRCKTPTSRAAHCHAATRAERPDAR